MGLYWCFNHPFNTLALGFKHLYCSIDLIPQSHSTIKRWVHSPSTLKTFHHFSASQTFPRPGPIRTTRNLGLQYSHWAKPMKFNISMVCTGDILCTSHRGWCSIWCYHRSEGSILGC